MSKKVARFTFAAVVLLTLGATAFRVITAPDRVKERRNTARAVCIQSGGEWATLDGDEEICRRAEPAIKS